MRIEAKIARIAALLEQAYGPKRLRRRWDNPLDELILTVLSQNTSDANSGGAYRALRRVFPTWEQVRRAREEAIADAIRSGGLANLKAARIKGILEAIWREQGHFDLSFLRDLRVDEVKAYLRRFDGIGAKTVACVMLFALGKPAFPVDTHIFRVTRRLGLFDGKTTPEKVQEQLEGLVPPRDQYALHVNLIEHGRRTCRAQQPRCPTCVLRRHCQYYRR